MLLCQRGQSLLIPSPSSLLTLTLKLYHTHPRAGRAGAPRPPTFRKTNAPAGPFFADAFGFVTVHDGILKQRAGHAGLIASIVLPLCGIAIASTPPLLLHQWGQTLWAPPAEVPSEGPPPHSNKSRTKGLPFRFINRQYVALVIALSFCYMVITTPPLLLHQ